MTQFHQGVKTFRWLQFAFVLHNLCIDPMNWSFWTTSGQFLQIMEAASITIAPRIVRNVHIETKIWFKKHWNLEKKKWRCISQKWNGNTSHWRYTGHTWYLIRGQIVKTRERIYLNITWHHCIRTLLGKSQHYVICPEIFVCRITISGWNLFLNIVFSQVLLGRHVIVGF